MSVHKVNLLLYGVLCTVTLFIAGCTRDEVFSAVSTAVAANQATRAAQQAVAEIATTSLPTLPPVAGVDDPATVQATAGDATGGAEESQPTAAQAPPETPTSPPATPTLRPSPLPSATLPSATLPSATPAPTRTPRPTSTTLPGTRVQDTAEMVLIAGGPFEMGTESLILLAECNIFRTGCQESWFSASEPAHTVNVAPFYLDVTEVTNAAYAVFLSSIGDFQTGCLGQLCFNPDDSRLVISTEGLIEASEEARDYPVTGVSWYGAAAYCEWRGGRLPAEAEWEKGAGWDAAAGVKYLYPWGDSFASDLANACDASCQQPQANADGDDGYAEEAPVASFEDGRSPGGAYDMGGNVWEWVTDWYDPQYYSNRQPDTMEGPEEGENKVVRGGSWFDTGNFAATAIRFPSPPLNTDESIGFRCAADP